MMSLPLFKNSTGEGVVTLQGSVTQGPELAADSSLWYHHVLVDGKRIFQFGCPCGTCGILFRKIGSPEDRLSDERSAEILGPLSTLPDEGALRSLARVLEPGVYHPLVLEGTVEFVEPGSPRDYFATDVVRLFGLEPPEYQEPAGPGTPYFRFGREHVVERTGRLGGSHRALITAILMPIHAPERLGRARVEHWKGRSLDGTPLTVLALSVVDCQAPAMNPVDSDYPYEEQFLFTSCLLDGHHRLQAAVELGVSVRVLSFLVGDERSPAASEVLPQVVDPFLLKGMRFGRD